MEQDCNIPVEKTAETPAQKALDGVCPHCNTPLGQRVLTAADAPDAARWAFAGVFGLLACAAGFVALLGLAHLFFGWSSRAGGFLALLLASPFAAGFGWRAWMLVFRPHELREPKTPLRGADETGWQADDEGMSWSEDHEQLFGMSGLGPEAGRFATACDPDW